MSASDSKAGPTTTATAPSAEGGDGREGRRSSESWLDRILTAVGLKPGSIRAELETALASSDVTASFTPKERSMLGNILRLREMRVDDIMVPRADIEAVSFDLTLAELFAAFRKAGHSRMPVFRDTLDDPIGLVHIKDLMDLITDAALVAGGNSGGDGGTDAEKVRLAFDRVELNKPLGEARVVRNILFVPPSMRVAALLANMQASRVQMALVIDEYGGTDGLVSIEDAVEVIVGDIEDEYDEEEGAMIVPDGKGGFLADARADLDELKAALAADLAPGEEGEEVDTVGGLVFALVGRVPVRGELISAPEGYEIEVLDADPRRVKRVRIYKRPSSEARRRAPRVPPESSSAA
jgi:CBS domain containing-hemolysin-like protein